MYCPNCGKELPDHAKFCRFCGSLTKEDGAASAPAPSGKKRRRSSYVFSIIIFLVVFAAALLITPLAVRKIQETQFKMNMDAGYRYLNELDYEQAAIAFQTSIKINPKNMDAYLGLSDAYLGQGEQEKAADILEQAIVMAKEGYEGDGQEVIRRLAAIYEEEGDYPSAHELDEEGEEAKEELAESERSAYIKYLIENLIPQKGLVQANGNLMFASVWQTDLSYYTPYEGIVSVLLDDLDGDSALEMAVVTSRLEITRSISKYESYTDKFLDLAIYKLVNGAVTETQNIENVATLESGYWGYMALLKYEHDKSPYLCLLSDVDNGQDDSYRELRLYQMENGVCQMAAGFRHFVSDDDSLFELNDSGNPNALYRIPHRASSDGGQGSAEPSENPEEYDSMTRAVTYVDNILKQHGADPYWNLDFETAIDTLVADDNLACIYFIKEIPRTKYTAYFVDAVDHSGLSSFITAYRLRNLAFITPAPAEITEQKTDDSMTNSSLGVTCSVNVTYPSLAPQKGLPGIDHINRFFQDKAQNMIQSTLQDIQNPEESEGGIPDTLDSGYTITFNNGYAMGVSVSYLESYGAQGAADLECYNFDLLTGLPLTLRDISDRSQEFKDFLRKQILKQISSGYDSLYPFSEVEERINNYDLNKNWLLDENGFTFWFNSMEIPIYEEEFTSYMVPYEECMEYLNEYGTLIVKPQS